MLNFGNQKSTVGLHQESNSDEDQFFDDDKDQIQSGIESYYDQHSVKFDMYSIYLLDAFTLSSNQMYIVRVMDYKDSKKNIVKYIDYVNKKDEDLKPDTRKKICNRVFVLEERISETSSLIKKDKRNFGDKYNDSLPLISPNKELICMPRFSNTAVSDQEDNKAQDSIIDVYDCSTLNFWKEPKPVDTNDGYFQLSLILNEESYKSFQTIHFSDSNKFLAVQCTQELYVYNLDALLGKDPMGMQKDIEIDTEKCAMYFHLKRMTYDRIISMHINEQDVNASRVILQSNDYATLHVLRLSDVIKNYIYESEQHEINKANSSQTVKMSLGGIFIATEKPNDSILVKIRQTDDPEFWEEIYAKFCHNGDIAIVQTQLETYQVTVNPAADTSKDKKQYFRVQMNPGLIDQCFLRGANKFFFCEQDSKKSYLQLRGLKLYETSDFSNTKIEVNGDIRVTEIIEFQRDQKQVLRVTAIRNDVELLNWEIIGDSFGKQYLQTKNGGQRNAFRWPFYAYANGTLGVKISYFADSENLVSHKIIQKGAQITRLEFSSAGNLYILVVSNAKETLYRMKIRKHFILNELQELKPDDDQDMVFKAVKENEICEMFYEQKKQTKAIEHLFIVEQNFGLEKFVVLVIVRSKRVTIVTKNRNKSKDAKDFTKDLGFKIENITMINTSNFIIQVENTNELRLLTIGYFGQDYYQDSLVFRPTAYDIVKFMSDKNNLFVLMNNGDSYRLSCFKLNQGLDLIPTGSIKKLQVNNPEFIEEFLKSPMLNAKILICSQNKFYKIYHEHDQNFKPSMQSFYNYLPKPSKYEKDRKLYVTSMHTCPLHNRILMQYSYPGTCKRKEIQVIPYIDDNVIQMNNITDPGEQIKTWLSFVQEKDNDIVPRIFQYSPEQKLLKEFDLVGLLQRQSNYPVQFDNMSELSTGHNKLRFLLTPDDSDYLEILQIVEITEGHEFVVRKEIKTRDIYVPVVGREQKSLYDLFIMFKEKLKCNFQFEFNNQCELIIICVLPAGYMFAAFYIYNVSGGVDSNQRVHQFFASETQQRLFNNFMLSEQRVNKDITIVKQHTMKEDNLSDAEKEIIKQIVKEFKGAQQFVISENKVILWSKYNILHGILRDMKEKDHSWLTESKFKVRTKFNESIYSSNSGNLQDDLDAENQQLSSEDYIETIYSRNKVVKTKIKGQIHFHEVVTLKVHHKNHQTYLLQYILDQDQELTWLFSSQDVEVFYDQNFEFMAADPELGVINLQTKEVMNEYHIKDHIEGCNDLASLDLRWGNKMVQTSESKFMMLPNRLVMPYSLLSFIQNYQSESKDDDVENFFVKDYYKINGQTQMHKFMYKPVLLEKLIDNYWHQDENFLISVLVKQEFFSKRQDKTEFNAQFKKKIAGLMQASEQSKEKLAQQMRTDAITEAIRNQTRFKSESGKDTLDVQLETNCDNLINKILHYLSKLPMQLSFNMMKPKMYKLCEYSRFYDYLEAWPQQSAQMKSIKMIYTDLNAGINLSHFNCSYLKSEFFEDYPTEKPAKTTGQEEAGSKVANSFATDDDYQRATDESIDNDDGMEDEDDDDNDKSLQQVNIQMLQVDWLTERWEGRKFLRRIAIKKDCLRLFDTQTVEFITDYLWQETKTYFICRLFMPFVVFGFLPLLVMAFLLPFIVQSNGEDDAGAIARTAYLVSIILFNAGSILQIYDEINEMIYHSLKSYFTSWQNYFQWAMVCVNTTLSYKIYLVLFGGEEGNLNEKRIHMMYAIILNLIELFYRIKVFDYFANFVRQLEEIVKGVVSLAAMLGLIVFAQAILFWILDLNSFERTYVGAFGFFQSLIDSYMFALGEFDFAENFSEENTEYSVVFWMLFMFGTIISLLILLNMVIAMMDQTYGIAESQTKSYIMCSKLEMVTHNYYRLPYWIRERFQKQKYLLSVDVDPEVDPIEKDSMEKRLGDRLSSLEQIMESQVANINSIKLNLISFYDKFCQSPSK